MNKSASWGVVLGMIAASASAQDPSSAVGKRVEAYNRCMTLAALRASYTKAANRAIYGIARAACASARDGRTIGRSHQPMYLAAVDAADAERARHLADWVGELRDRRRTTDAVYGMPSH